MSLTKTIHVRLWHSPYNGGWIGFDWSDARMRRCDWGRNKSHLWWCVFGFWGSIYLQSWPWQKSPGCRT